MSFHRFPCATAVLLAAAFGLGLSLDAMALWRKLLRSAPSGISIGAAAETDFFLRLDRLYRRPLASYFQKRIREAHDVEDLVQEVFLRLSHRSSLQDIAHLEGYVFQTAANVLCDRARRRAVRLAGAHASLDNCELPTNDFSPERVLQAEQQLEMAIAALGELPQRTQQVFVLRLYEDLRLEEIAARLKMSVEGVRFHLRRVKTHLAESREQEA